MTAFGLVWRHPTLRGITAALLALGAFYASVFPYQSLIAIDRIGLTEPQFGMVMVLASVVAVTTSVYLGVLSDQRSNRRAIAVLTTVTGSIGVAAMLIAPGPLTFVLAHGICLPITTSLYGQVFALTRLATTGMEPQREAILSTVRAAMSVSFTGMLIFWTWGLAAGAGVMSVYVGAALSVGGLLGLFLTMWPRDGQTDWVDAPSGKGLRQTFRDIAHPPVLLRLLCFGAMSSAGLLNFVLIALIFTGSETRSTADVALFIAMIAGWEVPFMLLLPRLLGRLPRTGLIVAGATLYCAQMALMPFLVDTWAVWLMPVLAGMGGTAVITLPITYFQDLMAGRPGTAGSMLALQRLVGDVLAAGGFVAGTALGSYGLTAALGAALAMIGAAVLLIADGRQPAIAS